MTVRWSRYYLFTTREVPKDAEIVSHRLMVRAGMIRKLTAGIYSYLPFGWRSIAKQRLRLPMPRRSRAIKTTPGRWYR